MQPTRLCRATVLLGGACIISAWIFDDPSFFFAGGALWLFLLLSLHTSISAARKAALSLTGERHTKERFSRSGTRIHMTNTLTSQVQPGYVLEVEDILPDSATDITGKTTDLISDANGTCTLRYSFRLLAHGTIHPGGITLRCSDALFSITIPVRISSLQNPALFVFPEKGQPYECSGGYGDRETMRRTPIKSTGIRSFREYQDGDNMKTIDWKMTARYGKTYVREYTGSEGGTATLIVDLPIDTDAVTEDMFSSVRKAIIQRVADILDRRDSSLMIVLSGSEIVAVMDIVPGADILNQLSDILNPKRRLIPLYRAYSPIMLAAGIRNAGENMPLSPIAQRATGTFATSAYHIIFEETMYRILSTSQDTEIHCYTTGKGDLSQIWSMATSAYALHRPVILFLPEESFREEIRKEAEFFNVRSFEVIQ
ncbi:DUF58 domain-containing protein [Methanogenium marinum]|uniref:DUF58 domain-containing protein n=1 Tax=Methanogenium marinum TaxID=348610 RepID=A0A9Q4KUI4_9EURY|nr:DUF58 domain-containing protein [Methanogenium marinum]MDE4909019.1 DUF58 domain-containing protein [Methanogenium marinum]